MFVIKEDHLGTDRWLRAPDDAALPGAGPILVSLDRWRQDQQALDASALELGLSLRADQSPVDIPGEVNRFNLITVEFPTFTDGRGYTAARLLRERLGYRGELRAVGDTGRDQFAFLRRCGFDAVEVADGGGQTENWEAARGEFNFVFQAAADGRAPVSKLRRSGPDPVSDLSRRLRRLCARYDRMPAADILDAMIRREFSGQIALVSSFGAEAAVLLHMVSEIDPAIPVLFLNTGKIFGETLRYRAQLVDRLGLQDVRDIKPSAGRLDARDPGGVLWASDPDACCYIRKVEPLNRALTGFSAWITGRKRIHGGDRSSLPVIEAGDGRFKVNPLAGWRHQDVADYFAAHDLPRHPLEADGYLSIGCMPCTDRAGDGEGSRDGRWRGSDKTECGIHLPVSNFRDYGGDI